MAVISYVLTRQRSSRLEGAELDFGGVPRGTRGRQLHCHWQIHHTVDALQPRKRKGVAEVNLPIIDALTTLTLDAEILGKISGNVFAALAQGKNSLVAAQHHCCI